MDVKRDSRRRRGVSRPAQPAAATPAAAADLPHGHPASRGRSAWKHDLHRAFARIRLDLAPGLVHVWEIMWDHLPVANSPFPLSHGTIAAEGGIDRTAAAKATKKLEGLGLIVCIRRGRLGRPEPNTWRFPQALPEVPKRKRRPPPNRPA